MKPKDSNKSKFFLIFISFILLFAFIPIPRVRAIWLSGWDQRVKITIDHNDIDATLTDFPVLIYIGSSSGRNGEDVTFIFDEVGANSLKIAITEDDGETECKVEIEKWDFDNEKAWLWVKVPSIVSDEDTDIYLYYDNDHADNNDNVGVVGSDPGESVWDASFECVLHLSENVGDFLDSTSNDNDASTQGTVNRGTQIIEGGIDLPGTDDYVRIDTVGILDGLDDATIEAWVYLDTLVTNRAVLSDWGLGEDVVILYYDLTNNKWRVIWRDTGDTDPNLFFGTTSPSSAWYHIATKYVRDDFVYGYENGIKTQSDAAGNAPLTSPGNLMFVGINRDLTMDLDGKMDEIRISSTDRSDAWLLATFESGQDDLLDFGEKELSLILSDPNLLFGAGFNASSPYMELHWNHSLVDVQFFEVQNSSDAESWTYLGQSTTTNYTDSQVVNGTERYYRVRACNQTEGRWYNSSWSDVNFDKIYFVESVAAAEAGDTIIMGGAGVFWIILIIIVPIVVYMVTRR